MKKRLLFIIVYIILFPTFIVAMVISYICMVFIAPIVWICTGDEDKAWGMVFGGVQGWIIQLPYKIFEKK